MHFLLLCFVLSGCATLNSFETFCQSTDEAELSKEYLKNGIEIQNFEVFANQCSKYGYRVPSIEKFLESYNSSKLASCSNPNEYFKISFRRYTLGRTAFSCQDSFSKDVKDDAYAAYYLTGSIKELDASIDNAHKDNGKKKYDSGFILDVLLRAMFEPDPVRLEHKRETKLEELKKIISKYGLFVSDLGAL